MIINVRNGAGLSLRVMELYDDAVPTFHNGKMIGLVCTLESDPRTLFLCAADEDLIASACLNGHDVLFEGELPNSLSEFTVVTVDGDNDKSLERIKSALDL